MSGAVVVLNVYTRWLGIPQNMCPPTYYQLLGVSPAELNPAQIQAAVDAKLQLLLEHCQGPEAQQCRQLIDEINNARTTLLDPIARQRYDQLIPHSAETWWSAGTASAPTAPAPKGETWWDQSIDPPPVGSPITQPAKKEEKPVLPQAVSQEVLKPQDNTWWDNSVPAPSNVLEPIITVEPEIVPEVVEIVPEVVEIVPEVVQPAPPAVRLRSESEELAEFEEVGSTRRRSSQRLSALPIILVLLVLGGGGAFGVYYWNKQKKDTPSKEVVSGPGTQKQTGGTNDVPKPKPIVEGIKKKPNPPKEENKIVHEPAPKKEVKPKGPGPKKESMPATLEILPEPRLAGTAPKTDPEPKKVVVEPKKDEFSEPATYQRHKAAVVGIAITPDARDVLTVSQDNTVVIHSIRDQTQQRLSKFKEPGVAVAVSDDGKVAAFCDGGEVTVFDLVKLKPKKSFFNPRGGIECLGIIPGSGMIITGSTDGTIRFWTGTSDTAESSLDLANQKITKLAISADGRIAVVGFINGMLSTIDLKKHQEIKHWTTGPKPISALAVSPDGKRCVSASEDRVVREWESETGKPLQKFTGHEGFVLAIHWTSDGNRIVTGGIDKRVILWDTQSGNAVKCLGQTGARIDCLAIDPKNRFVLVGQADGSIQRIPIPPPGSPKDETPKADGS